MVASISSSRRAADCGPKIVDQPARDRVQIIRDRRMEPDVIAHAPRAACSRARAAAKASSAAT